MSPSTENVSSGRWQAHPDTLLVELRRQDCLPLHLKRRDRGGAEEIVENEFESLTVFC